MTLLLVEGAPRCRHGLDSLPLMARAPAAGLKTPVLALGEAIRLDDHAEPDGMAAIGRLPLADNHVR